MIIRKTCLAFAMLGTDRVSNIWISWQLDELLINNLNIAYLLYIKWLFSKCVLIFPFFFFMIKFNKNKRKSELKWIDSKNGIVFVLNHIIFLLLLSCSFINNK